MMNAAEPPLGQNAIGLLDDLAEREMNEGEGE
jgi:hypothetical protein